jgi:hypothetical protein
MEVSWDLLIDAEHGFISNQTIEEGTSIEFIPLKGKMECKTEDMEYRCTYGEVEYRFPNGFEKCNKLTEECEVFRFKTPLRCLPANKEESECVAIDILSKTTEKRIKNSVIWYESEKSKEKKTDKEKKEEPTKPIKWRYINVEFMLSDVNNYQVKKMTITCYKRHSIKTILLGAGCREGKESGSVICRSDLRNGVDEYEFKEFNLCYESEKGCLAETVNSDAKIKCTERTDKDKRPCDNIAVKAKGERLKSEEKRKAEKLGKRRENESITERKRLIKRYEERKKKGQKCSNNKHNLDICYEIMDVEKKGITLKKLKEQYNQLSLKLHPDKCLKDEYDICGKAYIEFIEAHDNIKNNIEGGYSTSVGSVFGRGGDDNNRRRAPMPHDEFHAMLELMLKLLKRLAVPLYARR